MQEAWCIQGDFNAVLHPEDRIGGEEVKHIEVTDFRTCLEDCELVEVRSTSAYYTWINKTMWSRIDRVLANSF